MVLGLQPVRETVVWRTWALPPPAPWGGALPYTRGPGPEALTSQETLSRPLIHPGPQGDLCVEGLGRTGQGSLLLGLFRGAQISAALPGHTAQCRTPHPPTPAPLGVHTLLFRQPALKIKNVPQTSPTPRSLEAALPTACRHPASG